MEKKRWKKNLKREQKQHIGTDTHCNSQVLKYISLEYQGSLLFSLIYIQSYYIASNMSLTWRLTHSVYEKFPEEIISSNRNTSDWIQKEYLSKYMGKSVNPTRIYTGEMC